MLIMNRDDSEGMPSGHRLLLSTLPPLLRRNS